MRINTSAPSNANDTSGTVIGAQTSMRDTKQDIADYTDYGGALSMVTNAPLHTFRYIKEVEGYGPDSPLMASVKEMNLKLTEINNFEKENTWRDSLISWFSNASNHITRIFTGEVCLTEAGQESVCLNRAELQSLKNLLNNQTSSGSSSPSTNTTTDTTTNTTTNNPPVNQAPADTTPVVVPEPQPQTPVETSTVTAPVAPVSPADTSTNTDPAI